MSNYSYNFYQVMGSVDDAWANRLNNARNVVGTATIKTGPTDPGSAFRPAVWLHDSWLNPTIFSNTPQSGGGHQFIGINDYNEIIETFTGIVRNLPGNTLIDLSMVIGQPVQLTYINNERVVLGYDNTGRGFAYDLNKSEVTWINPPPGYQSVNPWAASASGLVICGCDNHTFCYYLSGSNQGQMKDLGICYLRDINSSGIAVGTLLDNGFGLPIWMDCSQPSPKANLIGLPPGAKGGSAMAINSDGTIVGYYETSDSINSNGFVSPPGILPRSAVDLNWFAPLEWHVFDAFDINDAGDIVGTLLPSVIINGGLLSGYILEKVALPHISQIIGSVLTLLGGTAVDGSGTVIKPSGTGGPVPPWGPENVAQLNAGEREVLAGLATAKLAELFSGEEIRKQIQRAGLAAASQAVGKLQRRLTAQPVAITESQRALIERRRQLLAGKRGQ